MRIIGRLPIKEWRGCCDGYKFIGAELTEEYLPIIEGRLNWAYEQGADDDEKLF